MLIRRHAFNFGWINLISLAVAVIVALNFPLQFDKIDNHETHASEVSTTDDAPAPTLAECHTSGACSPMQLASSLSPTYAIPAVVGKLQLPLKAEHETYLAALDTPPPRV